ncbi:MAG: MFS transporter [Planctomycetes bacterium]|nr:MFS transporter [Planctomycetota bacterium]
MSTETATETERPTIIRHGVMWATTVMALLLYLDRFAVGIASEYIREDLRMTQAQMGWFLSAFFWSYALAQVPAGWFADRFGARRMLSLYILAWSVFTGLMGVVHAVSMILILRLLCGVSQAGAYPTAGGLLRVWFPISRRGFASSIVALGGRAGGVLAPILTAWLIVLFSQSSDPGQFGLSEITSDKNFLESFQSRQSGPKQRVVERLKSRLPESVVSSLAGLIAPLSPTSPLILEISALIHQPDLFDQVDLTGLKLPSEAEDLRQQRKLRISLSDAEAVRMNRFILEAAMPNSVKKFRGVGWRPTMILYGVLGIIVAVGFYAVSRDLPRYHPWCNSAERALINDPATQAASAAESDAPFPWLALLTNVGLWGNSLMQAFTNIGWVFVVTWLPRYLDKVHGVPLSGQAYMTAIPTAAGIVGMYLGGWWTDKATLYAGRKWGRMLPVMITRFTAGLGYAICLVLSLSFTPNPAQTWLPWAYVGALCLMAFSVDMGNPAVWGYAQDVGGKYTGSALGWANMWGNLGAAAAPPLIYNQILGETPTAGQWTMMFGVCLLAFVLSGLCALVMDSTKPLVRPDAM